MENRECPNCRTNKYLSMELRELERRKITCLQCKWSILIDHYGNVIDEVELLREAQRRGEGLN